MNKKLLIGLGVIGAAAVGVVMYMKRRGAASLPAQYSEPGAITGGLKMSEREVAELNGEPRQPVPKCRNVLGLCGAGLSDKFETPPKQVKPSNNVDQVKASAEGGKEVQGTSLVFRPENLGGKKTSDYSFQPPKISVAREPAKLGKDAVAPDSSVRKSSQSVDDPGSAGRELMVPGQRSNGAKDATSRALGVKVDPGYVRKSNVEPGAVKARSADGSSAYSKTITTDPGAVKARQGSNRGEVKASELPKFNLGLADVYNSQARALENDEPPTTSNRWFL